MPPRSRLLYRTKRRHRASRQIQRAWRSSRSRMPKFKKSLALKQHNFVERLPDVILQMNSSTLNSDGNLSSTHTNTFQLSDIPQVSSYSTLFEYFRIDKVIVEYRYKTAGVPANYIANPLNLQPFNEINPTIMFKVDHNDAVSQSVADLKQSARTKEKQLTNSRPNFTISLKPAVQTEAYKTITASAYIPKWGVWLAMQDSNVPHYGLKMNVQVPKPTANFDYGSIEIVKKMYFSVKNNE